MCQNSPMTSIQVSFVLIAHLVVGYYEFLLAVIYICFFLLHISIFSHYEIE